MDLHLIHTNDVHSHLDAYITLATQIRQLRNHLSARNETVFLFDIGDHADRMAPETDATMGLVNASLLRVMNYDAWVFGNNEGLIIPSVYWEALCRQSATPVLNGNLRKLEDGAAYPFFQDSLLLERNGVKIGIFGLTAPYNEYYHIEGTNALDPFEQIPRLAGGLRRQGADVVVLLSHLGLSVDRNIASHNPDVDMIIGSHTHHLLEQPEKIGDVWIAQAGKFANYFGHLVLDYDMDKRCLRNVVGCVVARDDSLEPDADLRAILEEWRRRADRILEEVVAVVPEKLYHHFHHESELGNLVVDEMRKLSGAELAFLNTGVFHFGLESGNLTRKTLLACCPSPINPVVIDLYGWQIRDVLEKALRKEYTHRRGFGFGFRGNEVGSLAVSGLKIWYGEDDRLLSIEAAGEPLNDNRIYRIVTGDYLVFSGVYEEIARGTKIRVEPVFLREVMEKALANPDHLRQAKIKRWLRGGA
ncbi:bifunctional metallophosphatase/5'-nucleotidase [Effusibacillus dendaii]|uniref:Ser/threonine protein phosphatase n=1 Tax=Effusibacillus dendaii TaxID=2743772 RepID=A0A7I8D9Y4_9BACL|nr:bifunctional UDP-sugar hydrolase/5'-nucleotidase [Effusibacillus dendaii]BCJ86983.1 ser/threonine protein phosphatase [Effusibacillus dendaii]